MNRIRITFFLPSLGAGGAERVVVNLANGFINERFDVTILVANMLESELKNELSSDICLVNINKNRVIKCSRYIRNYLYKNYTDIFISSLPHCNIVASRAFNPQLTNTKLILIEHGMFSELVLKYNIVKRLVLITMLKVYYKKANAIICVSESVKKDLFKVAELNFSKVITIYNPVEIEKVNLLSQVSFIHPWFNKKYRILISVGRLVKEKGFDILIKAFSEVKKQLDVKLIIFGEGDQRAILQNLIHQLKLDDAVSLPGITSNPYQYIANSNLLIFPSLSEGFGNVLIESFICKTKVIAVNSGGGVNELLQNGKFGRLVPKNDVQALASAIIEEFNKPTLNIFPNINIFSTQVIINKYKEVIYNLLKA
ncbi:MAG: glycosyltransferase [Candidatus Marinimicrobia bacterium]|nr:glycosyltransferase [Candidatus Neomarinimicrobiota bacterium]